MDTVRGRSVTKGPMTQQHSLGPELRVRAGQGHALARWACGVLADAGVQAAPIKGVLLNATVYRTLPPCPVGDVDLLVVPSQFDPAEHALAAAGAERIDAQRHASTWRVPAFPLLLDLHRELIDPAWFALSADGVMRRATTSDAPFAPVSVALLDAYDVFVHLVADFAKSRRGARFFERLRDLRVWARDHRLDPILCAQRLHRCGVQRAARYVLGVASQREGDRFAASVVAALPADPLGELLAALAQRGMQWRPDGDVATLLLGHALNTTLPRGARSLLRATLAPRLQRHVRPRPT